MKKNYLFLLLLTTLFTFGQDIEFADPNFKEYLINITAGDNCAMSVDYEQVAVDANSDGEIQISEAENIRRLTISYGVPYEIYITNLSGIEYFSNLQRLSCNDQQLTSLDVSSLENLEILRCNNNLLESINFGGLSTLELIDCSFNSLTGIDLTGLTALEELNCGYNGIPDINFAGLENIDWLSVYDNQLTSIDVSSLVNLELFHCGLNNLSTVDVSMLPNLTWFACNDNPIISLNVEGMSALEDLYCFNCNLSSLSLSGLASVMRLKCYGNSLTSLDLQDLVSLKELDCSYNQLTDLDISGPANLINVYCYDNQLVNLQVDDLDLLWCQNNFLTSLDVSGCDYLNELICSNNLLTSLDLSVSPFPDVYSMNQNPQLQYLNIKNGYPFYYGGSPMIDFSECPALQYICINDTDYESIQQMLDDLGYTNTALSPYCSFVPGGPLYTVTGTIGFDNISDGCEDSDMGASVPIVISDGTGSMTYTTSPSGLFLIPTQWQLSTLTPVNPNPLYYNIDPPLAEIETVDTENPFIQNFCITATGSFYDLEVTLIPTVPARPGFDAEYRLIYRNKGTETESVSVDFNFNDSLLDFVSASITPNGVGIGNLNWENFEMKPFEEKVIDIILNVNSPQEDPAVNNGDELMFSASVGDMIPENMDETFEDNLCEIVQVVVGSFDPNDKTCLEGTTIIPDMVGNYVTYLIRFENTGDYYAENIVVVDMIDTEKFEISTLTPLQSSHEYVTRITEGNKVEFIFENIMLPGMPSEDRHGYVAFKIKTKTTLQIDDSFSNTAAIYFDFNHPIITNEAVTTVTILNTPDFDFNANISIYPNPTSGILNIEPKNDITLHSIEVYNVLGQRIVFVPNIQESTSFDVSRLGSGTYTVKVNTDKGAAYSKFIKN